MSLDLPDRVDIEVALKVASSYALAHFVIPKFPNIFVYREKSNRIFYMKLFGKVVTGPVGEQVPSSSDTDSELTSITPNSITHDKDKEPTSITIAHTNNTATLLNNSSIPILVSNTSISPKSLSRNNSHGHGSQGDKDSNVNVNNKKRNVLIMRVFGSMF